MSKENNLAKEIPAIIEFMEEAFAEEDGINKIALLKTVTAYYESLVTTESMRAMIIQTFKAIK